MAAAPLDLGDGLTLRRASVDDRAELVEFGATMHADADVRGSALAAWTHDLFDLPHYRQFGYTYALDLPRRPIVWLRETAPPPPAEFSVRAATTGDVDALAEIERDGASGTSLCPIRGTDGFAMELARRPDGLVASALVVVESSNRTARPVGYLAYRCQLVNGLLSIHAFELRRGISWLGPTAAVLSHLDKRVRTVPDCLLKTDTGALLLDVLLPPLSLSRWEFC